jgi:hypothetical protein
MVITCIQEIQESIVPGNSHMPTTLCGNWTQLTTEATSKTIASILFLSQYEFLNYQTTE